MKSFWEYALIRALKTICQTAVATIGTAFVLTEVDWLMVISASILAGILSILTSIATGLPETEDADDEIVDEDEEDDFDEDEYEEEEFEDDDERP